MKKYYMDMEFNQRSVAEDNGHTIFDFMSVGIVDEDGRCYYAVCNEFNMQAAQESEFINDIVLPRLGLPENEWKSRAQIREEILEFIREGGDEKAQIHYWWIPHDMMLFSDLMGEGDFLNMPEEIDSIGINLAQTWTELGRPAILPPANKELEHNSLIDAAWLRDVDHTLKAFKP